VPVQQSLVGVVIVTEVLQKFMSQMHDLPHPVVITLQEGMGSLNYTHTVARKGLT